MEVSPKFFLCFPTFKQTILRKKSNSASIIQDHFHKVFLVIVLCPFKMAQWFFSQTLSCTPSPHCLPPYGTSLLSFTSSTNWLMFPTNFKSPEGQARA